MGALRLCLLVICFSAAKVFSTEAEPLLKLYSDSLRFNPNESKRFAYNDSFKALLLASVEDDNGFDINLDSIKNTISILVSSDGKMKVISWVLISDDEVYTNHCLVLYRSSPKKLHKSYWLKDFVDTKADSLFEDFNSDFWPGALYYQMYDFKKKGKTYYCVLGLNGKNGAGNRKIIDVLWVDKDEELHIGAPVFYSNEKDYTPQYRVIFDFADQSTMLLRFETTDKLITFSNLVPSNPEKMGMSQYYIPDGRIDFYKLKKKGKWVRYQGLEDFDFPGNE